MICVLLLSLPLSAKVAMGQMIKIRTAKVCVRDAFDLLKQKTDVYFVYKEDIVGKDKTVSLDFKNATLQTVLDDLCAQAGLEYEILDNCVLIRKAAVKEAEVAQQAGEQITVTGVVRDEAGQPLPGATLLIKGTSTGTATNVDGTFELKVPARGAVLVVTFLGYRSQELTVGSQTKFDIQMKPDGVQLEEVQVVAYGTQKKVAVTGAISNVSSKELLRSPNASIGNILAGTMSGISTVQASAQPGADDPTIFVRGTASLDDARSKPLMLVDGVERSFFRMDPNEIENVTVLKDASATAVFGVRGANGVIMVTTKRGREGKAQIAVSSSVGVSMMTNYPDIVGSYDHARIYTQMELGDNPNLKPEEQRFTPYVTEMFRTNADPIMFPNTNWKKYLFKDASVQTQHNVSISGGTKRVRYFVSLGYLYQDGVLKRFTESYDPNYKNNRYNYRSNLDIDVTKSTLLSVNIGGRLESVNEPIAGGDGGYWRALFFAVPFASPGIVDGKLIRTIKSKYIPMEFFDGFKSYYGNGYKRSSNNVLNVDLILNQKLDMLTKGLSAEVKGSYNSVYKFIKTRSGSMEYYTPVYKSTMLDPSLPLDDPNFDHTIVYQKSGENKKLSYSEGYEKARDWYAEFSLRYDRTFGDHAVTGLLLYNMTKYYYPRDYVDIPSGYLGLVGRVTYSFRNKYLLDLNAGYNGSENFAKGKRYGFFPAMSVGWIVSEEKFMKDWSWLDYLKLRFSYGLVGNDMLGERGTNRFLYLADSYVSSTGGYNFGIDTPGNFPGAAESKLGNPNVTWETAAKQNYGIDITLFKQRLNFSFDYFFEKRKDILIKQNTVPGFVAADLPAVNMGKVNNHGYEISVKWNESLANSLRYWAGFNVSFARNKIVYKDEVPQNESYMRETGRPTGMKFGYAFDRFFEESDFINGVLNPDIPVHSADVKPGDVKYKDLNEDKVIDSDDRRYFGYSDNPEYVFGLNAGVEYKGVDFSMTWTGVTNTSRLMEEDYTSPFGVGGNAPLLKYMMHDSWTPENAKHAKMPRITRANRAFNTQASDLWLRDGSYIRLKNVELGYTFQFKALKKIGMSNLRFYVNGFNLLTFDKVKFIDPEAKPGKYSSYPVMKIYNAGINIRF